jgi:hypothetical protein
MLLGGLLNRLSDEAVALELLMDLDDLALLSRVQTAADAHGMTPGEVITSAVNHFTRHADSDRWLQLMTTINQSDNPGGAALKQMLGTELPG